MASKLSKAKEEIVEKKKSSKLVSKAPEPEKKPMSKFAQKQAEKMKEA